MDAVGIPVERLRRVRVGPLTLTGLPVGAWRDLTPGERTTLFEALHLERETEDRVAEVRWPRALPAGAKHAPGDGGPQSQSPPGTAGRTERGSRRGYPAPDAPGCRRDRRTRESATISRQGAAWSLFGSESSVDAARLQSW